METKNIIEFYIRMNKIQASGSDTLVLHRIVKNSIKLTNPKFVRKLKSDNWPVYNLLYVLKTHPLYTGRFTTWKEALISCFREMTVS